MAGILLQPGALRLPPLRAYRTRTRKLTDPVPPESSARRGPRHGPVPPGAGATLTVQPASPAPSATQSADSKTVYGGVTSRITMADSGAAPRLR